MLASVTLVSSTRNWYQLRTGIRILISFHITSQLQDKEPTIKGFFFFLNLLVPNTPSRSGGPSSELIGMTANLRPACPSPYHPQDNPLVSGPRAGDKVIFAVLENKLGIYKRKRKHTKMYLFLPKYTLSVLHFGGA